MRRTTLVFGLILVTAVAAAQQKADTAFDVSVKSPAYTTTHPRVVIDEAHQNFHTADGRYQPFAALLRNDGYEVVAGTSVFAAASLKGAAVLVISNALGEGATASTDTSPPAFTDAECDAVVAWVRGGGSLLLVSDHTPMGEAAAPLAAKFGVTMGKGFAFAVDPAHVGTSPTQLAFSRANGRLRDHPITRGRNAAERIDAVFTFTGQSLTIPAGAMPLMTLGPDAWEAPTRAELQAVAPEVAAAKSNPAAFTTTRAVSVAGRAQGIAMEFGKGRIVILGEAAMLSAQVTGADGQGRMGMNVPGSQNKQFALNVLHWLTRII